MFKMEFKTDNAAFNDDNGYSESVQILEHITQLVAQEYCQGPIHDSNGNTIGHWSLSINADQESV